MNSKISALVRIAAWFLPLLIAAVSSLAAQTIDGGYDRVLAPGGSSIQAGPYTGVTYSLHNGRFVTTEHNIVCCEFNEGRGFGPAAGLRMNIALGEAFFLEPSVGYASRGGSFAAAPTRLPFFGRNNEVETLTMQSTLDVSLATVETQALAGYRIGATGLYIAAGPSASFVVGQHYNKSERIADPSGVRYLDGSTEKELYDGDLDLVRPVLVAMRAGAGATIEIADGITLNPELLYSMPIGAASRVDDWKLAGLHGTLAVLFDL